MSPRLIVAFCGTLFSACSTLNIAIDESTDFRVGEFKGFVWDPALKSTKTENALGRKGISDSAIKSIITEQLNSRGYSVDHEKPELIISYEVVVKRELSSSIDEAGSLNDNHWFVAESRSEEFDKGAIIIDVTSVYGRHLLWRGWAEAFVNEETSPQKMKKLLSQSIARMFNHFPKSNLKRSKEPFVSTYKVQLQTNTK